MGDHDHRGFIYPNTINSLEQGLARMTMIGTWEPRVRRSGGGGGRLGGSNNNYKNNKGTTKSKRQAKDKGKRGSSNKKKGKKNIMGKGSEEQQQEESDLPTYDIECSIHILLQDLPASHGPVCHLTTCTYHDPIQVAQGKDKKGVTFARDENANEKKDEKIVNYSNDPSVFNFGPRENEGGGHKGVTEKKERRIRKKDFYNFPLGNLDPGSKEALRSELVEMKAHGLPVGFHNVIAYDVDNTGQLDVKARVSFRCARARKKQAKRKLRKAGLYRRMYREFEEFWGKYGNDVVFTKWERKYGQYIVNKQKEEKLEKSDSQDYINDAKETSKDMEKGGASQETSGQREDMGKGGKEEVEEELQNLAEKEAGDEHPKSKNGEGDGGKQSKEKWLKDKKEWEKPTTPVEVEVDTSTYKKAVETYFHYVVKTKLDTAKKKIMEKRQEKRDARAASHDAVNANNNDVKVAEEIQAEPAVNDENRSSTGIWGQNANFSEKEWIDNEKSQQTGYWANAEPDPNDPDTVVGLGKSELNKPLLPQRQDESRSLPETPNLAHVDEIGDEERIQTISAGDDSTPLPEDQDGQSEVRGWGEKYKTSGDGKDNQDQATGWDEKFKSGNDLDNQNQGTGWDEKYKTGNDPVSTGWDERLNLSGNDNEDQKLGLSTGLDQKHRSSGNSLDLYDQDQGTGWDVKYKSYRNDLDNQTQGTGWNENDKSPGSGQNCWGDSDSPPIPAKNENYTNGDEVGPGNAQVPWSNVAGWQKVAGGKQWTDALGTKAADDENETEDECEVYDDDTWETLWYRFNYHLWLKSMKEFFRIRRAYWTNGRYFVSVDDEIFIEEKMREVLEQLQDGASPPKKSRILPWIQIEVEDKEVVEHKSPDAITNEICQKFGIEYDKHENVRGTTSDFGPHGRELKQLSIGGDDDDRSSAAVGIPSRIMQRLIQRCRCEVMVGVFAGDGSPALDFAEVCGQVLPICSDEGQMKRLYSNSDKWDLQAYLEPLCGDPVSLITSMMGSKKNFAVDLVFIQVSDIEKDLKFLKAALQLTKCIVFHVDASIVRGNSDLELCNMTNLAGEHGRVEFERHVEVLDGKETIKAITVYYGDSMKYF